MKDKLFAKIDSYRGEMIALADAIFDHPELAMQEHFAVQTLCTYLKEKGYQVTSPVGGLETAFRLAGRAVKDLL